MHYRADLFTSGGRIQLFGNSLESVRNMIQDTRALVWGWQIVDLTTNKAVDYLSPNGARP